MPSNRAVAEPGLTLGQTLGEARWLEGDEGHRIAWWQGGDSTGREPALLLLHGGPGGRTRPEALAPWQGLPLRWIAFDQRGCGASQPGSETRHNTLDALIGDIERLRAALGIERWAVAGGSWGALLALAYLLRHPRRVAGLFLRSPFTGTTSEIERYLAPWPEWLGAPGRAALGRDADLSRLLQPTTAPRQRDAGLTREPLAHADAALADAWSRFDDAQAQPGGVRASGARWSAASDTAEASAPWRVFRHYAAHGWFLERPLLDALADGGAGLRVPLALVHGARDACCDPATSRALAQWHGAAQLIEVSQGGHRMAQPEMASALRLAAREWFERLRAYEADALQRSLR
jgi:proline iminopeptidase